jgi:hypothetical protein
MKASDAAGRLHVKITYQNNLLFGNVSPETEIDIPYRTSRLCVMCCIKFLQFRFRWEFDTFANVEDIRGYVELVHRSQDARVHELYDMSVSGGRHDVKIYGWINVPSPATIVVQGVDSR